MMPSSVTTARVGQRWAWCAHSPWQSRYPTRLQNRSRFPKRTGSDLTCRQDSLLIAGYRTYPALKYRRPPDANTIVALRHYVLASGQDALHYVDHFACVAGLLRCLEFVAHGIDLQGLLHGVGEQLLGEGHGAYRLHAIGELVFAKPALIVRVDGRIAELRQPPDIVGSRHSVFVLG